MFAQSSVGSGIETSYYIVSILIAVGVGGGVVTWFRRGREARQRNKERDELIDGRKPNNYGDPGQKPLAERITTLEQGQSRIEGYIKQIAEHTGAVLRNGRQ